jgi:hypothetical protein
MASMVAGNIKAEQIHGDRRYDRRYGIGLDLRWKLIRRRKVLEVGTGKTVDLSSGGIRFDAGRQLPLGLNIELSIAWPALLHNVAPMQLFAAGKIVRVDGGQAVIHLVQHEFRTAGSRGEHNGTASGGQRPIAFAPTTGLRKLPLR